jgi:hypothetical protein
MVMTKQRGPGGHDGDELDPELSGIAEEQAVVAELVDRLGGEQPGGQGPPGAAQAVDADHVQGVVVAEKVLEEHAAVADAAGQKPDEDGGHDRDESGGRGDGHQAGHGAGDESQGGGLAAMDPLHDHPAHGRGRGGHVGGGEGAGGQAVGGQGGTGVEAEPAEPQDGRAEHGQGQVVRDEGLLAVAGALAQVDGAGQGRGGRTHVHHRAAGEVQGAQAGQPAAAPDPVAHGAVDEDEPQDGEQQETGELDAFGEGPGDKRRGDDREHALKDHEGQMRDVGHPFLGLQAHAAQPEEVQPADDAADVRTERQGIAITAQTSEATPTMTMLCMRVPRTFLARTMPP